MQLPEETIKEFQAICNKYTEEEMDFETAEFNAKRFLLAMKLLYQPKKKDLSETER
jgi:hypothetical protein